MCMHTAKDHLVTLPCAHTRQRATWHTPVYPGAMFVCLAGSLPCGFLDDARQSLGMAHGNIPARQRVDARQRNEARQSGVRTAKAAARQSVAGAQQRGLHGKGWPAHGKESVARQSRCRPVLARRTAKNLLPGLALPCGLCRASTYGKAVAVSIVAFAMPAWRTATLPFPVVASHSGE
jgi:hypothetical protein